MRKNETELIIRRAQVTNNYVGRLQARNAHGADLAYRQQRWRCFFSAGAWSQTQLATVSGTITDPSGAVVPGVSITIVSQGTGLKRSALTDTGR